METNIDHARLINLPKIGDSRGNLSIIEGENHIPFMIQGTYWIYGVPGGDIRRECGTDQEFIVALSGSFDVVVDDGIQKNTFSLNRSYLGLYIPKGITHEMKNFSTNSLALVMSSTSFPDKNLPKK